MTIFESFERAFLFRLTRLLAMGLILVLLAFIVAGGWYVATSSVDATASGRVKPAEVIQALKPPKLQKAPPTGNSSTKPVSPPPEDEIFSTLKVPFIVQETLDDPDNLQTVRSWLEQLPYDQRQDMLNEMAEVLGAAGKAGIDPVDAVNKYKAIKFDRIESAKEAQQQRNNVMLAYAGGAATCTVLIALFSLILVLLAVERNTRRTESE